MKKILAGLAFLAMIFLLYSCSTRDVSESFPYGSYHYRSYNFLGDIVGYTTTEDVLDKIFNDFCIGK